MTPLFREWTEGRGAQTSRAGNSDHSRIVSGKEVIRTNMIFRNNFNRVKYIGRSTLVQLSSSDESRTAPHSQAPAQGQKWGTLLPLSDKYWTHWPRKPTRAWDLELKCHYDGRKSLLASCLETKSHPNESFDKTNNKYIFTYFLKSESKTPN